MMRLAGCRVGLMCAALVNMVSLSAVIEGTWARKADMPTATSLHVAAVVDGRIYAIGGTDSLYGYADYWRTVLAYDPTTNTWTRKADMPTGRARLAAAVVDGKIYAIGGAPHRDAEVSTVEMYDPANDVWSKRADMPRARNWLSASAVNGKIYVIGGKIYPSETMVATVEVYDPTTDTWARKSDMPTARGLHSASVVDEKIYVMGGITGALGPWVSTVEAYDPVTDTWAKKADMPTAKGGHSSTAAYGRIFVIGGGNSWSSSLSMVEVYDPATDTWAQGPDMPTARLCHSSSSVDGKIYVIGGSLHPSSWMPTPAVEVYDPRLPPDFNGDGYVDLADLLRLIESWGQDDPQLDVGPAPWGDGTVDAADLEVLMGFWGQEIPSPDLIAHWKLDETEGGVAVDSVGGRHGAVTGTPLWRATGGQVKGALELDGAGCIATEFILDPSDGAFSAFLWVKGGAPGQVILSQDQGANWLLTVAPTGVLTTELRGQRGGPLVSSTIITDGTWHHMGFVRDGASRVLYVDDVEVAKDTVTNLVGSTGGLYVGAGSTLASGTFFTGLIDDVRIYDRAVRP